MKHWKQCLLLYISLHSTKTQTLNKLMRYQYCQQQTQDKDVIQFKGICSLCRAGISTTRCHQITTTTTFKRNQKNI